ncbi:16011_t:CDS:2 [Dentiscutata heterogama]|uniref:16011_t:CDS:1 n=1 Tax=Dentiscutata heterogama TaxID=1316150 RepID=A0ACA9K1I3_9GLOM|nr:16011_t:CDS:2 [Dentiscutata heterogama]
MLRILENSDKHNTLVGVLDKIKDGYKEKIQLRVKYDNLHIYKGHVAGDYLLKVIHKKAIDAENRYQRDNVLSIPWIKNSETIRLEYFIELAKQIHNGDKDKAISHFKYPKKNDRRVKIRNYKSYNDISKFVNNYMTDVDVDYQLNIKDDSIDENFDMFHEAIMKELYDKRSSYFRLKEGELSNPSDDEFVMKRLGCTKPCYWCGALCWGGRGHHENSGETNRHHTSHQPGGLKGTKNSRTNKLRAIACHKRPNESRVQYIKEEQKNLKWDEAKSIDFQNWKFEPHFITNFNEIMCWFFEQLHEDLAEKFGCEPADESELKNYGCLKKDYNDIINVLHHCLENNKNDFRF